MCSSACRLSARCGRSTGRGRRRRSRKSSHPVWGTVSSGSRSTPQGTCTSQQRPWIPRPRGLQDCQGRIPCTSARNGGTRLPQRHHSRQGRKRLRHRHHSGSRMARFLPRTVLLRSGTSRRFSSARASSGSDSYSAPTGSRSGRTRSSSATPKVRGSYPSRSNPTAAQGAPRYSAEGLPLLAVDGIAFDVHGNGGGRNRAEHDRACFAERCSHDDGHRRGRPRLGFEHRVRQDGRPVGSHLRDRTARRSRAQRSCASTWA